MTTKKDNPTPAAAPAPEADGETIDVRILNMPGELDDLTIDDEALAGSPYDDIEGGADPRGAMVSEDMAATILATPFSVAAAFLGNHWELSKGELQLMAPPAARVFSDLFGRYCSQYPDAYMLGFALCAAIGTRAAITVNSRKKAAESLQPTEAQKNAAEAAYIAVPDMGASGL